MSALKDLADRERGEAICVALKAAGMNPVWLEAVAGQIAVGFQIMGNPLTWTKAVKHDAATATPDSFIALLNEWKNGVRKAIVNGAPSTIVRNMIEAHGINAVLDALVDTPRARLS